MSTSQGSIFDDASEIVISTPIEIINQTTGSSMTSSMPRGARFYFQCAVVVMGLVGAALNGLILYALVASKQHQEQVLIFNQNLLDFVTCFFLFAKNMISLFGVDLRGTRGYWLCVIVFSEGLVFGPFFGSLINLAAITIERYLKVVHHVWAKKKLRTWMIYSVIPFAWIGGNAVAWGWTIPTTDVIGGVCYTLVLWKSRSARMAFSISYILTFYVGLFLTFIFCYWRILMVIRRQARVMASHGTHGGSSAAETQIKKMQSKLIKTMILVSVLYIVLWTPGYVHFFLMNISVTFDVGDVAYYVIQVIGFLYNCVNPFIYATNFDPVMHVLLRMIPWKRNTQPLVNVEMT